MKHIQAPMSAGSESTMRLPGSLTNSRTCVITFHLALLVPQAPKPETEEKGTR